LTESCNHQTEKSSGPPDAVEDKWIVFMLVGIGVFMSTLDGSIVNIALPAIMKDLQVPLATIEWIPLIYLLTVSSLLLTFGRLSDIKGRRWVYCRGFIIFSVGSLLCGAARGAAWLIAARSFQGIGAAMLMACSPALVMDVFPPMERGRALGIVGTVVAAGLTSGPPLGGLIVKYLSWRFIFYINIPIGIVTAVLAARILKGGRADHSRSESFDWLGAFLLAICFCSFVLATKQLSDHGVAVFQFTLFVGIAAVSAVGFFRIEMNTPHPIFDPSLLNIRLFILPIMAATLVFASLFAMVFLMPFYLVQPRGLAMDKAGIMMVIPFIFFFFVSPLSGTVSDRTGSRMLCTIGMVILSAGLFALSQLDASSGYVSIAWRLALTGIGTSIFIPPNSAAAMSAIAPQRRGIASGTVATARNLGMVIGVAVAGLTFNSIFSSLSGGLTLKMYRPELESFFITSFQYAMLVSGAIAGIGAVVSYLRGPDNKNSNVERLL